MSVQDLFSKYQPCKVQDLVLDLCLREDESRQNTVTRFPVESGADLSDHVVREPLQLTFDGFVTNSPIKAGVSGLLVNLVQGTPTDNARNAGTHLNFAEMALAYLRQLADAGNPITVTTQRGVFTNVVPSFRRTRTRDTGDALTFTLTLTEIRLVKLFLVPAVRTKSEASQPLQDAGKQTGAKPSGKATELTSWAKSLKDGATGFFEKLSK